MLYTELSCTGKVKNTIVTKVFKTFESGKGYLDRLGM